MPKVLKSRTLKQVRRANAILARKVNEQQKIVYELERNVDLNRRLDELFAKTLYETTEKPVRPPRDSERY